MESSFSPGQNPAEQDQTAQHFPLHNSNAYGVANQFADVPKPEQEEGEQDEQMRIKRKRASKACDACRARKVKCDVTRNPCPQCAEHQIPCRFTAPTKKRGPPNAYVERQRAKMGQEHPSHGLDSVTGAVYISLKDHVHQQISMHVDTHHSNHFSRVSTKLIYRISISPH